MDASIPQVHFRSPRVAGFHELTRRETITVTIGVLLTLLLVSLDQTIVGTAMPRIVADLNGLDLYAWVTTAYLVASTAVVPISGKLGDLFGRKPFILAGMIGFVLASALCGLSQDMFQLVLFRGVQGLFGGFLMSNLFATIADIFPPARRARMQGLFAAVFGLSSVIGPTAGGWITDGLGWRWVFYVNLPVGLLAVSVILIAMPLIRSGASWRDIDFLGSASVIGAIVPLLVALSISRDHAWLSPLMVGLLLASLVMGTLFVLEERRAIHPIVPLDMFGNQTFTVSVITVFLVSGGMFGSIIFIPLIFQGVLGLSAASSGQLLTPMMFAVIGTSIVTGYAMTRVKHYRFIGTAGLVVMAWGLWLLSGVTPSTTEAEVVRDIVVVGLGLGTTMPLYNSAVMSAVPPSVVGVATSQLQFWRSMGGTIAVAFFGSILAHRLPEKIDVRLGAAGVPPQAAETFGRAGASAHSLFDPAQLAALRAQFPPQAQALFEQVLEAVKLALAETIHDIFAYGLVIVVIAAVVSTLLHEVPLRDRPARAVAAAPAFGE